MFDGTASYVGGQASGSMFPTYQPTVASKLGTSSPVTMNATYKIRGDEVTVVLDTDLTAAVTGSNSVHFLVCLDDFHYHPNFVVATLASETFTPTAIGQSQHVERTFTLDPAWDRSQLNVIMMVQNSTTRVVLQAARAMPAYEANVTLDCEPDGLQSGWVLSGPYGDISGNGDASFNLFDAGQYTVTWAASPFWTGPSGPQVQTVAIGGAITFEGTYTDGPFAAVTAGALGVAGQSRAGTLVDVDEDGDLDIHVVRNGEVDLLLRNDGALGFTDIAAGVIADAGAGTGAAWADLTGDGHLDVYVTRANQANLLLRGDGTGAFTAMTAYGAANVGPAEGANFVDFNLDGKLDIYLFQNNTMSTTNLLLLNFGDIGGGTWLFTGQTGNLSTSGNSGTVAWTDGDLDGRLDPFVIKRYGANQMFQNLTIGFNDATPGSGLSDSGNETAAAWGDFDNDGDFDLYLASDGGADKLFRASTPFHYELVSGANLGDTGPARGATWADLDNDTHLDLYVARNGQPDLILLGDGTGAFTRVMPGVDESEAGSYGTAAGDLDGDGRVDIFVPRLGQPNVVMKNGLGAGNHWFKVQLNGIAPNRAAIGARVVLTTGGVSQSRLVTTGSGSPTSLEQHFGLGAATTVDQVDIYWPSGLHQVITPKPADITLKVTEGQAPVVSGVDLVVPAVATVLGAARPNPFNPSTTIAFTMSSAQHATLAVYTVDGRLVRTLLDGSLPAGAQTAHWDGTGNDGRPVASGTYLYRLRASDGFDRSGRMTLVK
ncbi:MAG: VCBS repeat-containing protein [bacterium]|nr:VCBS repeat-containing protein [bacterium]